MTVACRGLTFDPFFKYNRAVKAFWVYVIDI